MEVYCFYEKSMDLDKFKNLTIISSEKAAKNFIIDFLKQEELRKRGFFNNPIREKVLVHLLETAEIELSLCYINDIINPSGFKLYLEKKSIIGHILSE